ncbi:hypothetical protein CNY62_02380 [Brochothrix thermosphacta]|uniref:Uncharacterized protein n=1 Tax=Brochothrix thermosphacta TaxID=2756 RepID=A0A291BVK3_BROTH|nr:hypothetical protein [Brochothrix thermosphacta]ATF25331.1 hypothetical protein CNY62_02380 [Brochothrix thermosphacta]
MTLRYGDYPPACPPEGAVSYDDLIVYRACCSDLVVKDQLNIENFMPVFEQKSRKFPPQKECGAKAISVNSKLEDLKETLEKYPSIGDKIIKFKMNKDCGVAFLTHTSHYNLWDYRSPNIIEAIGESWEEEVI